jgi:hypothetical protein
MFEWILIQSLEYHHLFLFFRPFVWILIYILLILETGVTSHYEIDQSMNSISDMKKIFWGEAKQNPQKLNILFKITSELGWH